MGKFYGMKILNGEVNRAGEVWTIKMVPILWRKRTEAWLAENAPKSAEPVSEKTE